MIAVSRIDRRRNRHLPALSGQSRLRVENWWLSQRLPALRGKTGEMPSRSFANRSQPASVSRWRLRRASLWRELPRQASQLGPISRPPADDVTSSLCGLATLRYRGPMTTVLRSSDPLLQSYRLKHLTLKNRIMSTAHEPHYPEAG